MKVYLGIDFNISRTIVTMHNIQTKNETVLYNEPSVGYLPRVRGGACYYGSEALNIEVGNYYFKSLYLLNDLDNLLAYFDRVITVSSKGIGSNAEVEYLVINKTDNEEILETVFKKLSDKYKFLNKVKVLTSYSFDLFNIGVTKILNEKKQYKKMNFLCIKLDEYEYAYSFFSYTSSSNVPMQSKMFKPDYSIKKKALSLIPESGLYGFARYVFESYIKSNRAKNVTLKEAYKNVIVEKNESSSNYAVQSQLLYKLIVEIANKLIVGHKQLVEKETNTLTVKYKVIDSIVDIVLSYDDYKYAVEQVIYKKDGLWTFIYNVLSLAYRSRAGFKILLYGTFTKIVDILGLINSVSNTMFGYGMVIPDTELLNKSYNNSTDYTVTSLGASLVPTLSYDGKKPLISFVDYFGNKNEIANNNTEYIASASLTGSPIYCYQNEYKLPLKQVLSTDEVSKLKMVVNINGINHDISGYLYDKNTGFLVERKNSEKTESNMFISNLKIGITERPIKQIVFDFNNDDIKYQNEFVIEEV